MMENIPLCIRVPTDFEIVLPAQHQEVRMHFRSVYTSFLITAIKLRKYEYVPSMTKRTFDRIRASFSSLREKHAHEIEQIQNYRLPLTIIDPLIDVVRELSTLSDMIKTKHIVEYLTNEIEWNDDE
jgi:hypothetical protein